MTRQQPHRAGASQPGKVPAERQACALQPGAPPRTRLFFEDTAGAVLIEFALSLSILMAMVFAIMDFSRAMYAYRFLPYAATQATRYAMVRVSTFAGTSCATTATFACNAVSADLTNYVQSLTPPGMTAASFTVTSTWPGTTPTGAACANSNGNNSPGCVVKVVVTYAFNFVMPFLPKSALSFAATSAKVILE